jgi:hypothetical protein
MSNAQTKENKATSSTRSQRSGKTSGNYNSLVIQLLGERPIAFNPILGRVAKSASAGLFLSQLLYWCDKGANRDWIYKTIKEVQEETCLTRSEQDRAIKIWKRLDVLEVKLRGIPRRRFFHVNKEKLIKLLENASGKKLSIRTNQFAENSRLDSRTIQSNTESTSQNTNKDFGLQTRSPFPKEIAALKKEVAKKYQKFDRPSVYE